MTVDDFTFEQTVSADPFQFIQATSSPMGGNTYEALTTNGKRKGVSSRIRSEDEILTPARRNLIAANGMDLYRNSVLFAWVIRRHLDYNTLFDFQPCNDDDQLNDDLRALMTRDSRAVNCDIGGRHSWNKLRRLAEVRRITDGDCGLLQLRSGHLQGVESHQIKTPRQRRRDINQWLGGVKLGAGRRALAFGLTEKNRKGELRERVVPASQMLFHASFDSRFDQVRGVSPLTSALNDFRDFHETKALVQEKVKLDQIFGVAFLRDADADPFGDDEDEEVETSADGTEKTSYSIGDGVRGFDLDEGEDLKIIQSQNPSTQTQSFLNLSIAVAIKALDIPFNFFDESFTNYSGSRIAWIQYERACESRREDQQELHRQYTLFRLRRWLLPSAMGGTGELILPRDMTIEDLKWKWVPRGIPWWKPQEELNTDIMAAAMGLKDLQQICDERGLGIWSDNVKQMAKQVKQARAAGADLAFNPSKLLGAMSFSGEQTA